VATEIGRSLEEIDNKIKGLNKTLKASAEETSKLGKVQCGAEIKGGYGVTRDLNGGGNGVHCGRRRTRRCKETEKIRKRFEAIL
jgi:hypothetical protein